MTDELQFLQQRIERLETAAGDVRDRLANCIQVAARPEDALALARGIAEALAKRVLEDMQIHPLPTLDACLRELERPQVMSRGLMPSEIISLLHMVRIIGNKAAHGAMRILPSRADVCLVLQSLLRVVEWYFAEFDRGPKISPLFRDPLDQRPAAKVDPGLLEKLLSLVQGWHDEVVHTAAQLSATDDDREARRIEFVYVNTRKYLPQILSLMRLLAGRHDTEDLASRIDAFIRLLTETHGTEDHAGVQCRPVFTTTCRSVGSLLPPLFKGAAGFIPFEPSGWAGEAGMLPADVGNIHGNNLALMQTQLQAISDEVIKLLSDVTQAPARENGT